MHGPAMTYSTSSLMGPALRIHLAQVQTPSPNPEYVFCIRDKLLSPLLSPLALSLTASAHAARVAEALEMLLMLETRGIRDPVARRFVPKL